MEYSAQALQSFSYRRVISDGMAIAKLFVLHANAIEKQKHIVQEGYGAKIALLAELTFKEQTFTEPMFHLINFLQLISHDDITKTLLILFIEMYYPL